METVIKVYEKINYMPESPEKFYSRGAEEFAEEYPIERVTDEYLNFLDKFVELTGDGKVLDAGCGTGRDVAYFTENGLEATGIDLAENMLRHARENKKGDFHKMDVRDLDFDENRFDGIWCNTVIQLFPPEKMGEVFSELDRVIKPDGVLYISFKLGEGEIVKEKYGGNVKQYLVPERKAREIVKSQGYDIVKTSTVKIDQLEIFSVIGEKDD